MNKKRVKSGTRLSIEGLLLQGKLTVSKGDLAKCELNFAMAGSARWLTPFRRIERSLFAWEFRVHKKQVEWFAKEAKKKLCEAGIVGAELDEPAIKLADIRPDSDLRCSNKEWENSMGKAYDDLMRFVTFYCNKLENARL